jgi:hypothetical protein
MDARLGVLMDGFNMLMEMRLGVDYMCVNCV